MGRSKVKGGDKNIKTGIEKRMKNKSSLVVLVGKNTHIAEHNHPADNNEINPSKICKAYDTPFLSSTNVYAYIKNHLSEWVEEAIRIRRNYP